jgi:hypothetical protein
VIIDVGCLPEGLREAAFSDHLPWLNAREAVTPPACRRMSVAALRRQSPILDHSTRDPKKAGHH